MQREGALALGAQALLCFGVGMILLANDEIPKPNMYLEDCYRGSVRGEGGGGGGGCEEGNRTRRGRGAARR